MAPPGTADGLRGQPDRALSGSLVRAEKTECFAITEPGAGSDILSMATRADKVGNDWVINGSKHFVSSHILPDFAIVFAVTGTIKPIGSANGSRRFWLTAASRGFYIVRGPRCVSQRAYLNFVLSFNDCRVGPGQVLGEEGEGLILADKWIKMGRVWVGAGCWGGGTPAGTVDRLGGQSYTVRPEFWKFQGTSFKLADMATELQAQPSGHARCTQSGSGPMTLQMRPCASCMLLKCCPDWPTTPFRFMVAWA
ncbi:MAG: hypothetical protein Ct9H300mP14_05810 [Gammaproteobacteria bacterium]|nr:MAG: hypothetical protein Ct9H300mP14_05810 [Gammaproteobacteria bacterium]